MIIENQNSVKKRYQPPILEVVMLDNHIALEVISEGPPPIEPDLAPDGSDSHSKKLFPDAPASDSPFGGSSPNYK
ncbi:MAG TPA: hypothetical protein VJ855_05555 [Marinilabiliaceae bacterium]|nr:hypothetical protein [Marinilabiliaceae bacterium]